MGVYTGPFIAGSQPTTAFWNELFTNDTNLANGTWITNLEIGAVTAVKLDYKFSVYRNAAWTAAGSAYGKVQFDTKEYDTGSNFDNTTNFRFTAPVAGFYCVGAGAQSTAAAGALAGIALYKNGSIYRKIEIQNGANTTPIGPGISVPNMQLAANDYIEVWHYGSGSTGTTGVATFFSGFLVSTT